MAKIQIDIESLIMAMENHLGELEWYLNTESGEIVPNTPFGDLKDEEYADEIETGSDRLIEVKTVPSEDGYRIMEDFIATLDNQHIRNVLTNAISQRRPFRRFKDAIFEFPEVRNRWFAFCRDAMMEYGREWLDSLSIDYELADLPPSPPKSEHGAD
jgi:hypothetical protein